MEKIEVKIVKRAPKRDLLRLYRQAGWWRTSYSDNKAFLDAMVSGSFCFAGAFAGGLMVGMGRAVSDGVSDAYIHDVTVLKNYRGMGLGKRIVQLILAFLREKGIEWIGLVAEPEAANIYRELGFRSFGDYTPMIWELDD